MAERMTTIRVRDDRMHSWSEYGRKTRAEMIAEYRRIAQRDLEQAQKVLSTPDDGFEVHTHTGVIVRHNIEEVTD